MFGDARVGEPLPPVASLDALGLPERRAGNLLVWRGEELLLVVRSAGAELDFRVLAFTLAVSAVAALVAAIAPTFETIRGDLIRAELIAFPCSYMRATISS